GLGGGGQRHRVAVAAETRVDPQNVDRVLDGGAWRADDAASHGHSDYLPTCVGCRSGPAATARSASAARVSSHSTWYTVVRASWIRCTDAEGTTNRWSSQPSSAMAPPESPARPTVTRPRRRASVKAAIRLGELPLVDSPTAMSPGRAKAASCRANAASKPMS